MSVSVRGIVVPVIADHVPHERELLDHLDQLDDGAVTRLFTRRDEEELLGFGLAEAAGLITPVVWLAVSEFVTRGAGVAADGFFGRLRARFTRRPAEAALAPLSSEQLQAVYQRIYDESRTRGLDEATAKQLADAVVARLARGPVAS